MYEMRDALICWDVVRLKESFLGVNSSRPLLIMKDSNIQNKKDGLNGCIHF